MTKFHLKKSEIRLNISRRTLFYWKKKYEWDRKRFKTEQNQEIFSNELLDFTRELMQKIFNDIDNDRQTPQSEIYSLMNILKNIPEVKQHEISASEPKSKQQNLLTLEHIRQIEREVLGGGDKHELLD